MTGRMSRTESAAVRAGSTITFRSCAAGRTRSRSGCARRAATHSSFGRSTWTRISAIRLPRAPRGPTSRRRRPSSSAASSPRRRRRDRSA
eukprot:3787012-Prymnesium_polylepis.1